MCLINTQAAQKQSEEYCATNQTFFMKKKYLLFLSHIKCSSFTTEWTIIENDKAVCHILHCDIITCSLKLYNDELYEEFWSRQHTIMMYYNLCTIHATILHKQAVSERWSVSCNYSRIYLIAFLMLLFYLFSSFFLFPDPLT